MRNITMSLIINFGDDDHLNRMDEVRQEWEDVQPN